MDLFFEVYDFLKADYDLSRWVRFKEGDISIKIYSANKRIVSVVMDHQDAELCYLYAAKHLIEYANRNDEIHAKSSTGKESQWVDTLKEQLGIEDEVDNADA